MFREFNKETAGLLKKTLELSGTKNLSVFPMKKGGGYLLSMNGNEFLLYREDKRMFLSAPNFQKDFRNAISFIVKKKPCDYYFFKGSHCWTWKASKFINSSRGENLARVFRLAGVRKKFSIKIGRPENLFSGKIGKNFFIGQWFISSGFFVIALEEIEQSLLKSISRIMRTEPLANYRQSLAINGGEIFDFFVWDNMNPKCTGKKLVKQDLRKEIFNLNFSPKA